MDMLTEEQYNELQQILNHPRNHVWLSHCGRDKHGDHEDHCVITNITEQTLKYGFLFCQAHQHTLGIKDTSWPTPGIEIDLNE